MRFDRRLLPLVLLVGVFVLPVLAAWALYLDPQLLPAARAHHGTLLEPPVRFPQLGPERWREKWSLLWVTGAVGRQECAATLLRMRNLRVALRENGARLQLLAVSADTAGANTLVNAAARYPDIDVLRVDAEQVAGFYLIDPLGNLMMRYESDADASGILEDLQRLLEHSPLGRRIT